MKSVYGNVELYSPAKRGYGECTRLYNNKNGKAIDFGRGYNEYQHSVSPVEGEAEKIKKLLDNLDNQVIENILDLCGTTSDCSIYRLWDYNKLKEVIKGFTEPIPINKIVETYEVAKTGDSEAIKDLIKSFRHLFGEGTEEDIENAHPFSIAWHAMTIEGHSKAMDLLHPTISAAAILYAKNK